MNSYEKAHQFLCVLLEKEFYLLWRDPNIAKDNCNKYIERILNLKYYAPCFELALQPYWNRYIALQEGPHHVQGCFKNINPDVDIDCRCQDRED